MNFGMKKSEWRQCIAWLFMMCNLTWFFYGFCSTVKMQIRGKNIFFFFFDKQFSLRVYFFLIQEWFYWKIIENNCNKLRVLNFIYDIFIFPACFSITHCPDHKFSLFYFLFILLIVVVLVWNILFKPVMYVPLIVFDFDFDFNAFHFLLC